MEVEAADASAVVPTVTEIQQMHEAEETDAEKTTSKASETAATEESQPKPADTAAEDPKEAEEKKTLEPSPAVDEGGSKPKPKSATDKATKVASETEAKGDKKSKSKEDTAASAKGKETASDPKSENDNKADASKVEDKQAKAEPIAPPPAESDSDSDSDIIVTSSEPMTIEKLTASMNLSRSVSAASAATSSSKKSVRFSEGTKGSSEESLPTPPEPEKKEATKENAKDEKDTEDDEASQFPNPYVEGFDRTGFLRKRLYARRDQWTTTRPVSIRIATYNVNDRVPPSGTKELGPLVGYGDDDIVVVGLQEADLRSSSMLVSQGGDRAAAWEEAIFCGFGDNRDRYERVELVQYVGVALFVFARSEIRTEIRRCETSARGIGLLGFGGNKAGVAARMKIFDTTVCFVCSRELGEILS